ncbi:MAG: hypothetical protein HZB43_01010 [candidate division Zixibacteria bacterium]|nr:hypothetical protein [candidate division Zixibacteria bacterium]
MPCLAGGLATDMACCLDGKPSEERARCPKRVLSCFYCIPARFVWEPPPVHATRDADHANALAIVASAALASADLIRQSTHAHSPPGVRPAIAGTDRRISICSFLL